MFTTDVYLYIEPNHCTNWYDQPLQIGSDMDLSLTVNFSFYHMTKQTLFMAAHEYEKFWILSLILQNRPA